MKSLLRNLAWIFWYTSSKKSLQGLEATLEVFTVFSEEEIQKKMDKKLKKAKKKARSVTGSLKCTKHKTQSFY